MKFPFTIETKTGGFNVKSLADLRYSRSSVEQWRVRSSRRRMFHAR